MISGNLDTFNIGFENCENWNLFVPKSGSRCPKGPFSVVTDRPSAKSRNFIEIYVENIPEMFGTLWRRNRSALNVSRWLSSSTRSFLQDGARNVWYFWAKPISFNFQKCDCVILIRADYVWEQKSNLIPLVKENGTWQFGLWGLLADGDNENLHLQFWWIPCEREKS